MSGFRIVLSIFSAITLQRCAGFSDRESLELTSKILKDLFTPGQYDKRIRPPAINATDNGTVVAVETYIRKIENLSEKDMEWTVELTLRLRWRDERLRFDGRAGRLTYITVPDPSSHIWMPDLFFRNEVQSRFHDTLLPNRYVKIYPDGNILYSVRLTLTLACPMDLKMYPFGRVQCQIIIASYGHTTRDLALLWRDMSPVQISSMIFVPSFTLEKFITDYCSVKTSTGVYSCLQVKFVFQREYIYQILVHYIPCGMMIFISWLAFWVDSKALLTRVAMQISALLVLLHKTSKFQESLPPLSYTKAFDVWLGVCLIFVILALVEVVLVNYIARLGQESDKEEEQEKEDEPGERVILTETNVDDGPAEESKVSVRIKRKVRPSRFPKFPRGVDRIDVVARLSFPVAFGTFLVFYFSIYT